MTREASPHCKNAQGLLREKNHIHSQTAFPLPLLCLPLNLDSAPATRITR